MYHVTFVLLLVHLILVHVHPTYVDQLQATWSDGFSFVEDEPSTHPYVIEKNGRRLLWGGQRDDQYFDVTQCRLELNQLHYGLGREAFAALLEPQFDSLEQAQQWMQPQDRVLLVKVRDTARVYPLSLLMHHEVVNDVVEGLPIFAAYCVLADLGAVYDRRMGEHVLTFGFSGYTYFDPKVWDGKDPFVLWDRETESLWWPPIGRAVFGVLIDRHTASTRSAPPGCIPARAYWSWGAGQAGWSASLPSVTQNARSSVRTRPSTSSTRAKRTNKLPNLAFHQWNYRWGKPEDLEPADVLLCAMGVVHHHLDNSALTDLVRLRRSREYITQRDHAMGYFSIWRSAANDGAVFFAALRIQLFARFVAWIDAAQQTGWTARLDQLWHVDMTDDPAPLPGLMSEARRSDPLPEEAIADSWMWFRHRNHVYARLHDMPALAVYRALTQKQVLATHRYYQQQILTRDEVGQCSGSGYLFTHDALYRFRLLLVSRCRAEALAAAISVKGQTTPINDQGLVRRASHTNSLANLRFCAATPGGEAFFGGASFGTGTNVTCVLPPGTDPPKPRSLFAG